MKKYIYTLAILSSIFVLGGCSKDDDDNQPGKTDPIIDPVVNPVDTVLSQTGDFTIVKPDSVGTATRPTDWNVISNVDPTGLMLVTIDANHIPSAVNSEDMMAAFVGDECRGVGSFKTDTDGKTRLSMVVSQCADEDCTSGQDVELRYYSAKMKRVFISDKFEYKQGGMLGSASKSYAVNWN